MKHGMAFATMGACLLVLPVGALAENLHMTPPSSISGTGKGQTGSNPNHPINGNSCGGANSGPSGAQASQSPFAGAAGTAGQVYAGAGANTGTPANSAAFSMYDVACFQAP